MNESCPHLASSGDGDAERDLQIETPKDIPLADALAQWRSEATHASVDTGRYLCRYFVWGEGPPLVFIHGLCERARSFVPMMAGLRRQFRCIAYELPEGGPDGARLSRYQHADLVSDLFAALGRPGPSPSVRVRLIVWFDDRARGDAESARAHPPCDFAGRIRLAAGNGLAAPSQSGAALRSRPDADGAIPPFSTPAGRASRL